MPHVRLLLTKKKTTMRNKLYVVMAQYPEDPLPLPVEYFLSNKQASIYKDYLESLWQETEETVQGKPQYFIKPSTLRVNAADVIAEDEALAWGSGEYA
jgi:hypothetical protein